MPATNMPSPSGTGTNGAQVFINPFDGPATSPLDRDSSGNFSTGALTTGIGFSPDYIFGVGQSIPPQFNDDYAVGKSYNAVGGLSSMANSTLVAIGGGKSTACVDGIAPTTPYTAGFSLCAYGGGSARDATPAGSGFATKLVTATGAVAVGAVIETGFNNRSDRALVTGESTFGIATASNAVPA